MPDSFLTLLTPEAQSGFGVTHAAPLAMADRVHHDECDALGHVNNTTYMVWFERLRIAFLSHYGISRLAHPEDPRVVIRSGHIHWIAEMFTGEAYLVTCHCIALRRTSLSLRQEVWSNGRQTAQFECVLVLLSPDGAGRMAIPDTIRQALIADGAVDEITAG